MLKNYLQDIFNTAKTGDAREESFYSALEKLFEEFITQQNKNFSVTTLPKKTEAGNPDFRIWDGKQKIVGYIEAKAPSVENLELVEDSEQLKRYRHTFPNLILTNFFEFRLYRNGELISQTTIGRPFIIYKLQTIPPAENQEKFLQILEQFFSFSIPKTTTAKQLAIELAKRTKFLKDQLKEELKKEYKIEGTQALEAFYKAFKDHLIFTLTPDEFANLFSQTVTYGLFVARSRADDGFNRELAFKYIPSTIGILKDVFQFISSTKLPISMRIIDDIAEVLAATNVKKIIENFYHEGKGKDPIIHFYETFLSEYDPKEREKRGVYYTPEPVVSYIVRSIEKILKNKFNKTDGFADNTVLVLDPASGTLTFPVEAIRLAIEEYKSKYGEGSIKKLIQDHILKNFFAFELMMAPYAVGHLKISLILDEYGYKLADDEKFNLFLTNTLELSKEQKHLPGVMERAIAKESEEALKVKEKIPILVVFGNPPYSVSSANKTDFIEKEMELYKEDVRQERNIQPLSDDYIKFIRFAHWKIEKTGYGVIGIITNNSYLSGLIHRGMRKKLLESFNEIYILNLHGNARINEKTPEGKNDENVFDIMQGVSIALFVKYKNQNELGNLYYQDIYGTREEKYQYLENSDIKTTKWEKLDPTYPYYFFVEKDFSLQNKYQKFISVKDIFAKKNAGIATGKDKFLVEFKRENLIQKLSIREKQLFEMSLKNIIEDEEIEKWYEEIQEIDLSNSITPYSYRPFDIRFTVYNEKILQRARRVMMDNFLKDNVAICITNTSKLDKYNEVFISNKITDKHLTGHQTYIFPLYLYEQIKIEKSKSKSIGVMILFDKPGKGYEVRRSNINKRIFEFLGKIYKKESTPEQIFYYIYAILYSNTYRQKYHEFLKIDFPRIPFTKDRQLFQKLAKLGKQLADLHLLKSSYLVNPIVKFYGDDSNKVEKREYEEREKRIYINNSQHFEGVAPEVWNYYIGGYQVLDKWLKDRKDHSLSSNDIKHYCQVATALSKTIKIQGEIDKLYLNIEKNLISDFSEA